MSPEGLLGVDSGKSVICCPWAGHEGPWGGHEAHGGGWHRAVRYQGTSSVVGEGYLEMALSCTSHRLQPARHTPAFPVLQSSQSVLGASH